MRSLTTLSPSGTDCLEIWEVQPPGNLRTFPALYRDCFWSASILIFTLFCGPHIIVVNFCTCCITSGFLSPSGFNFKQTNMQQWCLVHWLRVYTTALYSNIQLRWFYFAEYRRRIRWVDKSMEEVYHGLFEHVFRYLRSGNDKNYNTSGLLSVEC